MLLFKIMTFRNWLETILKAREHGISYCRALALGNKYGVVCPSQGLRSCGPGPMHLYVPFIHSPSQGIDCRHLTSQTQAPIRISSIKVSRRRRQKINWEIVLCSCVEGSSKNCLGHMFQHQLGFIKLWSEMARQRLALKRPKYCNQRQISQTPCPGAVRSCQIVSWVNKHIGF